MASVLSSRARCVLCSLCYLSCRLQGSPGALLSPPHIKASLISATLIATHPHDNQPRADVHVWRCAHPHSIFLFSLFLYLTCPHTHTHTEKFLWCRWKQKCPEKKFSVSGFPALMKYIEVWEWYFSQRGPAGYINDMKWYKLTYSRAAYCLIIMRGWWNVVEPVECHLSQCDECVKPCVWKES